MSPIQDHHFKPAEFSGITSLLPIPDLVLFPHVMQPVHVSEPRYRELLDDVLRGSRLITLAVLAPGWQSDYEGSPPLHPYACLARVVVSQLLDDGTRNLLLRGLRRVRLLKELPARKNYREATAMLCEDIYPPNQADQRETLKRDLHERLARLLPRLPQQREQWEQLLNSSLPLGTLTDVLGHALDLSLADKETLLSEVNVHRRAELLLGHLTRAEHDGGASVFVKFPPEFSPN